MKIGFVGSQQNIDVAAGSIQFLFIKIWIIVETRTGLFNISYMKARVLGAEILDSNCFNLVFLTFFVNQF